MFYDRKEINIKTLKMEDNHIRIVYNHHAYRNGGNVFPYFNFDKKKLVSDHIKKVAKTNLK